ncbi:ATP-binding protein [Streptomyces sp. NPDC017890]|uniref:ATP-binding protein n=1 Tax=Streptomyces sp. NPDC017890 TaxID=3365015 RepID=UPI00378F92A8
MTTTPGVAHERTCRRALADTAPKQRVITTYRPGGEVMNERFKVALRRGDEPPRREDACRVGAMRRVAAARLRYCGLQAMTNDVVIIVSELLTNALLHSGASEIRLTITFVNDSLRIAVHDGVPGQATPRAADHDNDESGRGLVLVDALAKECGGEWGTSDAGAETWCHLPVSTEERP